jgi:two-component sensor histidine kinase
VALPLLELARTSTSLAGDLLRHAQRLVATWQPLADLCFSDLLFFAPVQGEEGSRFVVLAHVRPTTAQTLYPSDLVGTTVDERQRPIVARAWRKGEIVGGDTSVVDGKEQALVECIPVRHHDQLVGVLTRETATTSGRRMGELERQYSEVFDAFALMIAAGTFPFERDEVEIDEAPRVADGVVVLDHLLHVRFASPNAMSSLHRMGIYANALGAPLGAIGFDHHAAETALRTRSPVIEEVERAETAVLVQATPLVVDDTVTGVLLLVRDVTDLRYRDRILMSKDATIREIHHRVKNNLQTIAALLRLQGRRLESDEARDAIAESERRVRSMAIVHETLARDMGDVVPFSDVVQPLVRVVEETVSTPELRLRFEVDGDAGDLPGEVATPLAVVLNELMQNAVDHAFPRATEGPAEGRVRIHLAREADELIVDVIDDGVGLPPGFSLDERKGLGLSIVHALVTGELNGSIDLRDDRGTCVHVRIPVRPEQRVEP